MTSRLAFIFVLLSAGFAIEPSYAGEVISCSSFETCPDGTYYYCASPGSGGSCVTLCQADEYVLSNSCEACEPGTTNEFGDDPAGDDTACDVTFCAANEYVSGNTCTACPDNTSNQAGDNATGNDTVCDTPPTLRVGNDQGNQGENTSTLYHFRIDQIPTQVPQVLRYDGAFVWNGEPGQYMFDTNETGFFPDLFYSANWGGYREELFWFKLQAENLLPSTPNAAAPRYTVSYLGFDVIKPDGSALCSNSNENPDDDCEGPGKVAMLNGGLPITMTPLHDIDLVPSQLGWDKFERWPMWGTDGAVCGDWTFDPAAWGINIYDGPVQFSPVADTRQFLLDNYPEEDPSNPGCLDTTTPLPFGRFYPKEPDITCKTKWLPNLGFSEPFAHDDAAAFFGSEQTFETDNWQLLTPPEVFDFVEGHRAGFSYLCSALGPEYSGPRILAKFEYPFNEYAAPNTQWITVPLFIRGRLPEDHHFRIYFAIEGDEQHPLRTDFVVDTVDGGNWPCGEGSTPIWDFDLDSWICTENPP